MTDTALAAHLLVDARQTGRHLAQLPENARPGSDAESYAIQDMQMARLGSTGAWKVGARSPDAQPTCGPLPATLVVVSPAHFARGRFPLQLVEAELAFRFAHDLPARARPYDEQDVLAAIGSVHATIEVLDSRYTDFRSVDGPSLLADFLSNGALVVGPGRTADIRVDQTTTRLRVYADDALALDITGGNTAGDVFRLLVWLANHAGSRCGGLRAGQVVTTGSCIGVHPVAPGTHVRAVFDGIPAVEAIV